MLKSFLALSLAMGASYVTWMLCCSSNDSSILQPDLAAWWGPEELRTKADSSIWPSVIKFDDEMIKDLKWKLDNRKPLIKNLEETSMEYGINTRELDAILNYWANEYKFADRERYLNKYPQYKTNIQGLNIHFIRVIPDVKPGTPIIPLILIHGWPGSVREFYEAIPLLTQQKEGYDFAIEVIVPSLPGFGFSDPAVRPGLGAPEIAVVFRNLMHRLGHTKFFIQGGDWGAYVASSILSYFPNEVLGLHSNLPISLTTRGFMKTLIGTIFPSLVVDSDVADRMYPYSKYLKYAMRESGYFHVQATKPDTIGVALNDSPTGLAAYIIEKFAIATCKDAQSLPDWLDKDGILDNLMIYWSTNSISSSMRLYAETVNARKLLFWLEQYPTEVPTWTIHAKNEIIYQSPAILRTRFKNLLHSTVLQNGGHFLAFELPEVFSEDVWKALKGFREWHNDKKG